MELTKFLVCGSIVEESEAKLFISRVLKAQKKQGPFSFALCCGGFNAKQNISSAVEETRENLALDIYVASERITESVSQGEDAQKTVHTISPFEVVEACGLRFSFIPFAHVDEWNAFNSFVESCVRSQLQMDIAILDVSLVRQSLQLGEQHSELSKGLMQLKPRYIFCSVKPFEYFDYGPFLFEDSCIPSRFIHLSNVGSNQKWLYALSLKPVSHLREAELTNEPSSQCILSNPFNLNKVAKEETNVDARVLKKQNVDNNEAKCWFCLANEKNLHLIIDVGQHCFLALAKGYLLKYHVLIVPIEHVGSRFELSTEAWKEIQFYLGLLENWWRSLNLQIFWFERNMKPPSGDGVNHMQIQVIGMPINESLSFVSNLLDKESKKLGVTIWELKTEDELKDKYHLGKVDEYILFKLPDSCYALHIVERRRKRKSAGEQSPYFALFSFGRKIAALALKMPQKIDWKKSVDDLKEEERVANELREEFLSWKRKMPN